MKDIEIALILSTILSFLISIIQVKNEAKNVTYQCLANGSFLIYLLIMAFGCIISTYASKGMLESEYLQLNFLNFAPSFLLYSLFGVFAFEGIIQKMNLTYADSAFLSINKYLSKARGNAVTSSIKKEAAIRKYQVQKCASLLLEKMDNGSLHTFIANIVGMEEYNKLLSSIQRIPSADFDKFLCLYACDKDLDAVKAAIKA